MEIPPDESPRQTVGRLQQDLREFIEADRLEHVIVVQRGLDRAARRCRRAAGDLGRDGAAVGLPRDAASPGCPLPASSLYAIAAMDLGCSYINFTPSLGSAPAAIDELARLRGTRHDRLRRQDGRDAA